MKTCSKCKIEKDLDQFGWRKDRNAPTSQCRECRISTTAKWREKNPGHHKKYAPYQRAYHFMKHYGLSAEDYESLVTSHDGCAICGDRVKLVVDHDHKTGTVRGMLCDPCNRGLGCFGDNPDRLQSAIVYLSMLRR